MTRVPASCNQDGVKPDACNLGVSYCSCDLGTCAYFKGFNGTKQRFSRVTVLCSAPMGKGKTK